MGGALRIPISLTGDRSSTNIGEIKEDGGRTLLVWQKPELGEWLIKIYTGYRGITDLAELVLTVEMPELSRKPGDLAFSHATIGRKYCPGTKWKSLQIPQAHYQTVVHFGDDLVFSSRGTDFDRDNMPSELLVTDSTGPIRTTVYWLPDGTIDEAAWVPILTTDPNIVPVVAEYKFEENLPQYEVPVYRGMYDFTFLVDGENWEVEHGDINVQQTIYTAQQVGVDSIVASCPECAAFGFGEPVFERIDEFNWRILVGVVDREKVLERIAELEGRSLAIDLTLIGRGNTHGVGGFDMKVRVEEL